MRRRTMLAGLGMLATGSGTVVSSAALASSTPTAGDFRVITAGQLAVRAGDAFNDDGSVADGYENRFIQYESSDGGMFFQSGDGLNQIGVEDIPVATVNARDENINTDLKIETAISISNERNQFRFPDILEIENTTAEDHEIGIGYRDADQYGDAVDEESTNYEEDVTRNLVQHIYQFRSEGSDPDSKDNRISPDPGDDGDFPNTDDQGNWQLVESGQTVQIDLQIDLTNWDDPLRINADTKEILRDKADENPFERTINTVDLLDGITIGTRD